MRPVALILLAGLLSSCLPATGPLSLDLRPAPSDASWTPGDLLLRGEVPAELLRPLPQAIQDAPLGSILIGCQHKGAMWGLCTHMTRKIAPDLLTEEPGVFQHGAGFRPLEVLLKREVVIVLDVGVKEDQLPALRAAAESLKGKPYFIGGQHLGYDCVTYQNALQRALGLPDIARKHPRWKAYLPVGALNIPTNKVLFVGMQQVPATP